MEAFLSLTIAPFRLQVLHYSPGQHYSVHHDYISVYQDDVRFRGGHNRMITVFFYLNDVEKGGETVFPYGLMSKEDHNKVRNFGTCEEAVEPALKIPAKKGNAIIFYHTTPKGQHENQVLPQSHMNDTRPNPPMPSPKI